jgi:hypothetical protein
MRKVLAILALSGSLAACAGVQLPPKAGPEEVEVIIPAMGQAARDGYRTIGPVTARAPLGTSQQEVLQMLRTEAAELGADAIIFERIDDTTRSQATGDIGRNQGLIGHALAIYYPTPGT